GIGGIVAPVRAKAPRSSSPTPATRLPREASKEPEWRDEASSCQTTPRQAPRGAPRGRPAPDSPRIEPEGRDRGAGPAGTPQPCRSSAGVADRAPARQSLAASGEKGKGKGAKSVGDAACGSRARGAQMEKDGRHRREAPGADRDSTAAGSHVPPKGAVDSARGSQPAPVGQSSSSRSGRNANRPDANTGSLPASPLAGDAE
ncbi:unnamed protein product, partial [Polarella glacialis]